MVPFLEPGPFMMFFFFLLFLLLTRWMPDITVLNLRESCVCGPLCNSFFFLLLKHGLYSLFSLALLLSQVMETKNMLYLVTEYAKNGEIFGE